MGWQVWLASPLLVTLAAAISMWWRSRPRPTPSVHARVREHNRFLDGLARHGGGGQPQLPEAVLVVGAAEASAGDPEASGAPDDSQAPAGGRRYGQADEPNAAQAAPLS